MDFISNSKLSKLFLFGLTIPAGSTSVIVRVTTIEDTMDEPN